MPYLEEETVGPVAVRRHRWRRDEWGKRQEVREVVPVSRGFIELCAAWRKNGTDDATPGALVPDVSSPGPVTGVPGHVSRLPLRERSFPDPS